jgi:hypothetical protein
MAAWAIAAGLAVALTATASAQNTGLAGLAPSPASIALVDSRGIVVARPLNETIVLVTLDGNVAAPAQIRPIFDTDGHAASGLATWQAGGSVLFTSADCTTGAHVYSPPYAGVRATAQLQTPAGIVLFVGAVGPATTAPIRSILYESGCAQVTLSQNGLLPVVTTINLTAAYPPPLSFR